MHFPLIGFFGLTGCPPDQGLEKPKLVNLDQAQKRHQEINWLTTMMEHYCQNEAKFIISSPPDLYQREKDNIRGQVRMQNLYPFDFGFAESWGDGIFLPPMDQLPSLSEKQELILNKICEESGYWGRIRSLRHPKRGTGDSITSWKTYGCVAGIVLASMIAGVCITRGTSPVVAKELLRHAAGIFVSLGIAKSSF